MQLSKNKPLLINDLLSIQNLLIYKTDKITLEVKNILWQNTLCVCRFSSNCKENTYNGRFPPLKHWVRLYSLQYFENSLK